MLKQFIYAKCYWCGLFFQQVDWIENRRAGYCCKQCYNDEFVSRD